MQTRHYDCEEFFRVLARILSENEINYVTQKAFDTYLAKMKIYFAENFNINCDILGDTNFKNFTIFTKQKFFLSVNENIAIFDKKSDLFNGIFHKKICEATKSQEGLSVFGLASDQNLNKFNFVNNLTKSEKAEIKNFFNIKEKIFE